MLFLIHSYINEGMAVFGENKKYKKMIENSFGRNPLEGLAYYNASKRMDKVKRYHNAVMEDTTEDNNWIVDEVTWNDLEMDEVFLRVNHTNSFVGEQKLYHKMHVLEGASENLLKRDSINRIEYLEQNPSFRNEIEMRLRSIGKLDEGYYLSEFLMNTSLWKIGNTVVYHLLQILLVSFFVLGVAFDNVLLLLGALMVGIVNLGIYLACKQKYEVFFTSLIELKKIYDFARWLDKKDSERNLINESDSRAVQRLGKLTWVVSGMNGRRQSAMLGDVLAVFREYLWGILLIDVAMFNHIMRIISDKQQEVMGILEFVGDIDSDIAILSYRKSVTLWCEPLYISDGIYAKEVAHPLLNNPVTNDFSLNDRAIITGSNASGKSTFMKSVAINCILGQSINTCFAAEFKMKPLIVVTCMALRDDILSGESYYYREAKCLKRMLDLIVKEENVLVVVDEILKGTNTAERIAASKAILEYIAGTDCMTLVATHDNELTETDKYHNYHFRNEIKNEDIIFDYLLHEGKSTQSNAIALLSHLGYPEEIVKAAKRNLQS